MTCTEAKATATAIQADRPAIALTMGDPAGIGPEIILQALADPAITQAGRLTVVGCRAWFERVYAELRAIAAIPPIALDQVTWQDVPIAPTVWAQVQPGMGNAASGAISFQCLQAAIAATLAGHFSGIVTAPIAKSAWHLAGHLYPGQTEVLAAAAQVEPVGMAFVARSPLSGWVLRTMLATTHLPLRQVPDALTPELMSHKLALLIASLRTDFGLTQPRIAIAGLNPHSGESGQLGTEEQDWLIPWLQTQRDRYPQVTLIGPVPPDTLWVGAGAAWWGQAPASLAVPDAYLALYHDQGLIPVKLLGFDQAVNTTIGLPFIRTSPDHGTAFDIVGQGCARATSLKAAIQLAIALSQTRQAGVVQA